jgi:hypothetical protein
VGADRRKIIPFELLRPKPSLSTTPSAHFTDLSAEVLAPRRRRTLGGCDGAAVLGGSTEGSVVVIVCDGAARAAVALCSACCDISNPNPLWGMVFSLMVVSKNLGCSKESVEVGVTRVASFYSMSGTRGYSDEHVSSFTFLDVLKLLATKRSN